MIKNTKLQIFLPIALSIAVLFGLYLGMMLGGGNSGSSYVSFGSSGNDKISKVLKIINKDYVDTVNTTQLTEAAISAILERLDPHSTYIPPVDLQAVNDDLEGNFDGVGIEFNIINDTIVVLSAISGGPSEQLGIRPGDRIIEIEKKIVAGKKITNDEVIKKLRGKKGTVVKVAIARRGSKDKLEFEIKRGKIPIHSVDASFMLDKQTGFVKISRFAANTFDEYKSAFKKLATQGLKNLVLDLRGNPGGYLDQAIDLADEFLKDEQLIVYTEGKNRPRKYNYATSKGGFESGNLVILIDEGSASASEIVAGAVQDHDRGLIIGSRSFGKGLVQEQMDFADGSALRLTVARYFTPSGRCIQRRYDNGVDEYYESAYSRFHQSDTIKTTEDTTRYYTDYKRIVFGGGGINPDFQVSMDTSGLTKIFIKIVNDGLINDFGFEFSDQNRAFIRSKYTDYKQFASDISISESIFKNFVAYLNRKGYNTKDSGLNISKALITNRLKAYIARNIWNSDAFYYVISTEDKVVKEALSKLRN